MSGAEEASGDEERFGEKERNRKEEWTIQVERSRE